MANWYAQRAWIGEMADDVLIEVEGDRISAVIPGATPPPDAHRLPGVTIPGLVNAHSHAFHRALRGRTHAGGDFWSWRDLMYEVAARLDPDSYLALAQATFAEMALAGITSVGEFHYVHHDAGGVAYDDPNAMGRAVLEAARGAGVRITLLDTCYLRGGIRSADLSPVQRRFTDGDVEAWAQRVSELTADETTKIGAAVHSVRAVDPTSMERVASWAREREVPLHMHVSEQRRENEECESVFGMSPTELAAQHGVLGPRTTVIHATHVAPLDVELLGTSRTAVCLCPTTERDLGDGVGPASAFSAASVPWSLGSDGHSTIDLFEEARAVEMDERLMAGARGIHDPAALLTAATLNGGRSLGWETGAIAPGYLCDLVALDPSSPRLSTSPGVGGIVFAATAADVTDVIVGGRAVVTERRHRDLDDVGGRLASAVAGVLG
jgi:formiminoglutamate deiminase